MRVLIIKLSSMGDLMHALPALTDAVNNVPGISFDWVVDENFAEVPKWHPAVEKLIVSAHRRWKKNLRAAWTNGEFKGFYKRLNHRDYDLVIDLQSNLKSALVSLLRRSPVSGYDHQSCREKPAHLSYKHQYSIPVNQHAIARQRQLFARIFGYQEPNTAPEYNVNFTQFASPDIKPKNKYVVFVHNASWETKLWPVNYWQDASQRAADLGYTVVLPSGNDKEFKRAQKIAEGCSAAVALSKTNLDDIAAIISGATAMLCSDTGLAHLAAMAATPAITLYAVTDTNLIGTVGDNQRHIVAAQDANNGSMADISVDRVWAEFLPLLTE
ncbi:lipopolysaccharide heptosyltransferase I [SAR92 clade bacterium H246]